MKRLITCFLFPIPCSLLLFAATDIYSTKIDTFQRVPEWFPKAADRWHTFGSDGHTNGIHWTTLGTLAAVESVFDAYHERAFYASEGRSNTWDEAVYGPRLSQADPPQLWFTNTLDRIPTCFVYQSWTNDEYAVSNAFCRGTPESRRLVEFDNIFSLAKWIPSLIARTPGRPYLDKGDTWGRQRDIMFGSSWGPCTTELPAFDWTDGERLDFDPTTNCVPLCYCARDTVFNPHSTTNSFLWDVMRDLDRGFNALYRIEGGPEVAYYPVRTNGYLAAWEGVGEEQTVPGIITNLFPHAGPEIGLTRLTRRLVPDDYEAAHYKTSLWVTVRSAPFANNLSSPLRKNGDRKPGTKGMTCRFDTPLNPNDILHWSSAGFATALYSLSDEGDKEDSVGIGSSRFDPDFIGDPGYDERVVVRVVGPIRGGRWSYVGSGVLEWQWFDYEPICNFVADFQRFVSETDVVEYASSVLATESRALAMLDRTYEIPATVPVQSAPAEGDARDVERRYHSSLTQDGETTIDMVLHYPFTELANPVYFPALLTNPIETEYTQTNIYSAVASTRARMRLYGVGDVATGTLGATADLLSDIITAHTLRLSLLLERLPQSRWIPVRTYCTIDDSDRITVWASYYDEVLQRTVEFWMWRAFVSNFVPARPVTVTFDAQLEISRSARIFTGGIHPRAVYERMYPWYGPGAWGYAERAAGNSRILFAEEMMRFVSKPYAWYEAPDEWEPDDPVALPARATAQEIAERKFTWASRHRMAVSQSAGGLDGGLCNRLHQERANVMQAAVGQYFREAVGDFGTPQALIPVSRALAKGGDSYRITGLEIVPWFTSDQPSFVFRHDGDTSQLRFGTPDEPGEVVPDEMQIHVIGARVQAVTAGDGISFNDAQRLRPVAVDGDLRPVIVTDWNWKALKAERTNP